MIYPRLQLKRVFRIPFVAQNENIVQTLFRPVKNCTKNWICATENGFMYDAKRRGFSRSYKFIIHFLGVTKDVWSQIVIETNFLRPV